MEEPQIARARTLEDLKREHGVPVGSRLRATEVESAEQSPLRNYVRDLVLGYNDGLVSVYAITAGVAGASFGPPAILLTGVAAATAGALSMAAGEYISTKSQAEFYVSERAREREHLAKWPHLEIQELRESLEAKGLEEPLLGQVVEALASDKERFLDYMMRDEFGVGRESERSPLRAAGIILVAFLAGALLTIVPYAVMEGAHDGLVASTVVSLLGLFGAGYARARASRLNAWRAGWEMVLIGALAGSITYGVGRIVGFQV